jgi:SAM-dependent methyltransferase
MSLFKKGLSPHQTSLAMIGAKTGSSVLVMGASDTTLAGEVALVTGISGRTLVVDPDPAAEARVEEAGGKAGALMEFLRAPLAMLPLDNDSFDVSVLPGLAACAAAERGSLVAEAFRVTRPGGRIVIVSRERRPGVFGAIAPKMPTLEPEAATSLLSGAGAKAVRHLASQNGVAYYEGRKG